MAERVLPCDMGLEAYLVSAILVAIILLSSIGVGRTLIYAIGALRHSTSGHRGRLILGASCGVALVAIAGGGGRSLQVASRTRPSIHALPRALLTPDLQVSWDFVTKAVIEPDYLVEVTRQSDGKVLHSYETVVSVIRLPVGPPIQGDIRIVVTALKDGSPWSCSEPVDVEVYQDSLDRIKNTRQLRVGFHVDNRARAFCYEDTKVQGFDVDLATHIVEQLRKRTGIHDLTFDPQYFAWPDILDRVRGNPGNTIDFAIASISITKERKKWGLSFSEPYAATPVAAVVIKGGSHGLEPVTLDRLRTLRVGVHQGTTAIDFAERFLAGEREKEVKVARNNVELFSWLKGGSPTIDVALYDDLRARAEAKGDPALRVVTIDRGASVYPDEEYGIALPVANARLRKIIDDVLRADPGRVRALMTEWVGPMAR